MNWAKLANEEDIQKHNIDQIDSNFVTIKLQLSLIVELIVDYIIMVYVYKDGTVKTCFYVIVTILWGIKSKTVEWELNGKRMFQCPSTRWTIFKHQTFIFLLK